MITNLFGPLLLGLFQAALPVPRDADAAPVDAAQALVDALVEGGLPGASAALVASDGTVHTWVAGVASRETDEPLTPEHRLLSGSVGKTYVTAWAHALVADGRLTLDDPIGALFADDPPEWLQRVPNASAVTLRQLLRHETGMPRYVFDPEFGPRLVAEPDRVWRPAELLAYVFDAPPLFAPGEGWAYSDTNYVIAGIVLETVGERDYYASVEERFLVPHELDDTCPSDRRRLPKMAQGHVVLGRSMGIGDRTLADGEFTFNVQFEGCGGGWASTPADLARWIGLLYSGRALDAPYLETLCDSVPAPALGPGVEYGLGAMIRTTELGPLVHHDGFMPGYLATAGYFRELDVAVALQLNTDDASTLGRPLVHVLVELAAAHRAARED